jgi:hypothetical protein
MYSSRRCQAWFLGKACAGYELKLIDMTKGKRFQGAQAPYLFRVVDELNVVAASS